jgi:hypothetical protein
VSSVAITSIDSAALADVGQFLNQNLNHEISPEAWVASLVHPWCDSRPNFGVQLRAAGELVGVFCAIYSDQAIEGRIEHFCNPHSWCVLDDYRNNSLSLALALIKQRGYHLTMLTPNPKVTEIFMRLGFKLLDERVVVVPNLPSPIAALRAHVAESDRNHISAHLSGDVLRDFETHREIPWLDFLAFGEGDDVCVIAYKIGRWKRMSCARINYVSDPEAFNRHLHLMQHGLLLQHRLLVSRVEARFVSRKPRFAYSDRRTQPKLFLSPTLKDSQIRDFYSELVALDL